MDLPQEATHQKLYVEERRAAILSMLRQNSSVQVSEIAETFGVSRVTEALQNGFQCSFK